MGFRGLGGLGVEGFKGSGHAHSGQSCSHPTLSHKLLKLPDSLGCHVERRPNIAPLIIRLGFRGPLYYTYSKETPK